MINFTPVWLPQLSANEKKKIKNIVLLSIFISYSIFEKNKLSEVIYIRRDRHRRWPAERMEIKKAGKRTRGRVSV